MSFTLLACKNPRWFTLQRIKRDESGNEVTDESGETIWEDSLDENGDKIKLIYVDCQWSHLGDTSQPFQTFIANPNDPEKHGRDLYAALVNGDHGTIADEYIPLYLFVKKTILKSSVDFKQNMFTLGSHQN